eukprot:Selendium_serpulae@DN6188_c0_g2_i2.p1
MFVRLWRWAPTSHCVWYGSGRWCHLCSGSADQQVSKLISHRKNISTSICFPCTLRINAEYMGSRIPFNPMMAAMYDDGVDYMMRTNDDSEFVTRGWITDAIKVLKSYNPPNIGVVGPNHTGGNTVIITHDMVHRSHLNIFDTYYPVEFQNWFVDTWMTNVYGPERTCKMSNWGVKHLVLPSRYKVDFKKDILSSVLDKSRQVLKERLAEIPSEEPGELKEPLDLDQICVTRKS